MNRFWTILIAAMAVGILVLVAGCSKDDNSNPSSANETDQSALLTMMTEDSDLEAVNSWAGDGDDGGGSPLDSAVSPIGWERVGHWARSSVNIEFQGDTLATITRTATFNGTFHMVIDTTGGVRTTIDKTMHNTLVRKAHARRVARTHHPRENWRIYEVTPEVMLSADSNTVHPARVQFFVNGNQTPILDLSDPLNTYYNRDSLPAIARGAQLIVVVTPNVTDTVAAYLHPHVWREGRFHRVAMPPAGNNTYSATFTVGDRLGVYLTAPDVLNHATLYTSDAVYDAGSWAIPYRVVAVQ